MYRLLVFLCLFVATNAGLVRLPKIYNALISSDQNLSPSHAYPVIEPVLRTTALGVAFPPLFIQPPSQKVGLLPQTTIQQKEEVSVAPTEKASENLKNVESTIPDLSYHGSLYPLAFDPYFPYPYSNEYVFPALPYYQQQPVYVNVNQKENAKKEPEKVELKPAVNFEKNPEIPDVPPPPLPIKEGKKEKE